MDPHPSTTALKKPKPSSTVTKPPGPPPSHSVPAGGSNTSAGESPSISPSVTPIPDSSSSKALSTPAIAGIAAAGGLLLLFIVSVIFCKRRRAQRYAKRDHDKHDPSRDPINPNDVLPPLPVERKFDTIVLDDDSTAYPMVTRLSGNNGNGNREGPAYPQYEEHIQSHFQDADRNAHPGRAEGSNSMERNRIHGGVVAPMSPSQRAQQQQQQQAGNMSPRSTPRSPRSQSSAVVNDMGTQFVMQSSSSNPGSHRPSVDQEGGSVIGSDQGHRGRQPPRSQDGRGGPRNNSGGPINNNGGPGYGYGPGPGGLGPYSGSPPVGPQRGGPGSPGQPYQPPYQQPYQHQPNQQQQQSRPYPQQQQQQPYPQQVYNGPRSPPMGPGGPRRDNSPGPGHQPRTQYS